MKKTLGKSGYIGILLILLGTTSMLFLFMKMYFTPTKSTSSTSASPTTQFDGLLGDINAAKAVSNQMNQKASETNRLMNSVR